MRGISVCGLPKLATESGKYSWWSEVAVINIVRLLIECQFLYHSCGDLTLLLSSARRVQADHERFFLFAGRDALRFLALIFCSNSARLIVFCVRRSVISFQNLSLAPSCSCSSSKPSTPTMSATGLPLCVMITR